MTELSDYQRMVERPHVESLEARISTLRAERDAKDAEIARLKKEIACEKATRKTRTWQIQNAAKICENLRGRAIRAEARLAAMATVTEADVRAFHDVRQRNKPGTQPLSATWAALEAFVANKTSGGTWQISQTTAGTEIQPADEAQSPDQACGAESDAAFVERIVRAAQHWIGDAPGHRYKRVANILASRPAPADAVRVLVEALDTLRAKAWNGDLKLLPAETVDVASAALSDPRVIAAQSADPWLPIASAPKDERSLLGWCRQWGNDVIQIRWLSGKNCWSTTMQPTHWMPLPAAPARQQGEPS